MNWSFDVVVDRASWSMIICSVSRISSSFEEAALPFGPVTTEAAAFSLEAKVGLLLVGVNATVLPQETTHSKVEIGNFMAITHNSLAHKNSAMPVKESKTSHAELFLAWSKCVCADFFAPTLRSSECWVRWWVKPRGGIIFGHFDIFEWPIQKLGAVLLHASARHHDNGWIAVLLPSTMHSRPCTLEDVISWIKLVNGDRNEYAMRVGDWAMELLLDDQFAWLSDDAVDCSRAVERW